MIEVGRVDTLLFSMLCFSIFGLIGYIYYFNKYVINRPRSDEDEVRRFIWLYFPRFHQCSTEEFYLFLKIGFLFLCVISVMYGLLFKMPLPFLGKPFFIYNSHKVDSYLFEFINRIYRFL